MLVFLHSKTCVAELWNEDVSDRQALIAALCAESFGGAPVNLAVPDRDGWVQAAELARSRGVPIHVVVTNAPAGTFPRPDTDSFFVNEERQANFVRNILRDAEYLLAPETAGVYCALQSHRIARFDSTPSLILAPEDPMAHARELCTILDQPPDALLMLSQGRKRFLEFG